MLSNTCACTRVERTCAVCAVILVSLLFTPQAIAQEECGSSPPVIDENLRGEIEGKAQLLSRHLGDASLSGTIEKSRNEIFSKYPDAELSRSNAYFEYQICISLMRDKTLSEQQKRDEWLRVREAFQKPPAVIKEKAGDGQRPSDAPIASAPIHRLSKDLILSTNMGIEFFEPPREVEINYKIFQSDFSLGGGMVTFKLDGRQNTLHLECGLAEHQPRSDAYQLNVIGDGTELLSQGYRAGENTVASDIKIQGVRALTLTLKGTYGNPRFYCRDELRY